MIEGEVSSNTLLDNLTGIQRRIGAAARRAGRAPKTIELVAVTKHAPIAAVRTLIEKGGVRWFGENRVQDGRRRREALGPEAARVGWRFIGHLQTNKVAPALEMYDWIDSVDSLRLAEALDKRLRLDKDEKRQRVLVQVKLTGKETQSGVAPGELEAFLRRLRPLSRLRIRGLMGIAPFLEPIESVRPHFRKLRELFERFFPRGDDGEGEGPYLSLGMSRDFEIAVEEGANLVRIGTSLFAG
ncbi:MAG: YggS family pyridoxal phosphate-dependent enzyme [Elusimicrobiota bacterium]